MSVINYNYAANAAANVINRNEKLMDRTMAKLSSGLNIGVGHNQPGQLGTYTTVKVEGTTARTGLASINSALARMKMVESVAMSMQGMLTRLQELAVAASDASMNTADRYAIDAEFGGIITEWMRLAADTKYNNVAVMTGTDQTIFTGGTAITIAMDDFRIDAGAANGIGIATGQISVGAANSAGNDAASSAMSDTVVGAAIIVPATLQETLITSDTAALSVAKLARIIPTFSGAVGRVGGLISRLEYASEAQAGKAVAVEAAASVIGDTDYAVQTAQLASAQVISQAATAILAQANARSSTVLTLLK
jgi:flagellin